MKVLIFSTVYPNPNNPTAGIFVHEQVKQLVKIGIEARVICPIALSPPLRLLMPKKTTLSNWKKWVLSKRNIPKEKILEGVRVYYPKWVLLPKIFFHQFETPTLYLLTKKTLKKIWRDWQWDLIHAHFLTPNGITAQKIAKQYGVPLVISCLGADLNYYAKNKTLHNSVKSALQFSDGIICKSKQLKNVALEFKAASDKIHVIHNGCNLSEFTPLKTKRKQKEILYIGQFIERKCLPYLIDAFRRIKCKETRLRLIGDGNLMPLIKEIVNEYDLQNRVIFEGIILHKLLPSFINKATVLCLPSHSEGNPNVVMESLSCGTPVVASNVGGIPDIVPSFCGILVPPKDSNALKNALEEALEKDWDYQAIRNFAEQNLSSEVQCKKIIKIYQQISCGKRLL